MISEQEHIDFIVRSDALEKSGGDTIQVEHYVNELHHNGIGTTIIPFHPSMKLTPGSIVHVINIDRPFDLLSTWRLARDHPIVVSTIHHRLEYVRKMRKNETGYGVRSTVGHALPEPWREWLAFVVRCARSSPSPKARVTAFWDAVRLMASIPRVWRRVGNLLDSCGAVLLLATGEGDSLRIDTGWRGDNGVLVPNGRPKQASTTSAGALDWNERAIPIVSIGRIEPRKRQLDVAKLAGQMGVPLTFAGPLHQPETPFGKEFVATLDRYPSLKWLGPLEHAAVLDLLARSRVLVNPSWVEVQSLVDLEAAFAGCFVVANVGGNSKEWLPNHVEVCEVEDIRTMLEISVARAASPQGPGTPDYKWTWRSATSRLIDVYSDLTRGVPAHR